MNRRGSRGQMVIRLIVFAGALTGLLAMHGLSDHGAAASHAGHAPSNHTATATVHSNQMATAAHGAAEDVGLTVGESDEGSPGMAMAGLCLAVLAGAIIGLLLLLPHRGALSVRSVALAFAPAAPSGRRDRDPPCLFELSVLRT